MKTLTINIPDNLELSDREAKMLLSSRLFEKGKLTIGQAAELVGLSKRAFLEILADYGVSPLNYTNDDIDNDLLNAKSYCL
jgi:predicted HTH domain antitoxin